MGTTAGGPTRRPPRGARPRLSWPVAAVAGPVVALVVALGVVATPFVLSASAMESIGITPGPNQVTNWSSFNYSGYQAQAAYPEYRALVLTMEHLGATDGCGQAMWQYDPSLNRFGTTQALMLLPYWSNGCIGSMEGLLFESASATTPYHFLNQAELSVVAVRGDGRPELLVTERSRRDSAPAASRRPLLHGLEHPGPRSGSGRPLAAAGGPNRTVDIESRRASRLTTTWKIYEVLQCSPIVTPDWPTTLRWRWASKPAQSSWLVPSESWYNDPSRWSVFLAQSGPASWPRVPIGDPTPPRHDVPRTRVTGVVETDNAVSFHVSKIGTPVLVKVSYFPNWQASGATGPYRVTPNLMVVVPTAHNVVLHYGASPANRVGQGLTIVGVAALCAVVVRARCERRREAAPQEPTEG